MFYGLVTEGLAFVLPLEDAQLIKGLHYSPAHWASKVGKHRGRGVIDSSDATSVHPVLNGQEVADAALDRFGKVEHPTVQDIVRMILQMQAQYPHLNPATELRLWKTDLRGAYTLLSFTASDSRLFAVELMQGLVIIFLCALFGHTATPAAFQVVSRVLAFELRRLICGLLVIYVDDIVGIARAHEVRQDIDTTCRLIEALLGPKSVAYDKEEVSTDAQPRLDAIGYTFDLELQTVSLTERNIRKTQYAFFAVDLSEGAKIEVRMILKLASLASRYSSVAMELRPLCNSLHHCAAGKRLHSSVVLSNAAKRTIAVWRAMLCVVALDPAGYARQFRTFDQGRPKVVIVFDASLFGIGIQILEINPTSGRRRLRGAGAGGLEQLEFGSDASYQNTAEFIAVVVGLMAYLDRLTKEEQEMQDLPVILQGDSVSALNWAEKARFTGTRVECAASLYMMLVVRHRIRVVHTIHEAGDKNTICDALSRRTITNRSMAVREIMPPGTKDLNLHWHNTYKQAVEVCDPRLLPAESGLVEHEAFWKKASTVASLVKSHTR
jgi:hypothetical protein